MHSLVDATSTLAAPADDDEANQTAAAQGSAPSSATLPNLTPANLVASSPRSDAR